MGDDVGEKEVMTTGAQLAETAADHLVEVATGQAVTVTAELEEPDQQQQEGDQISESLIVDGTE